MNQRTYFKTAFLTWICSLSLSAQNQTHDGFGNIVPRLDLHEHISITDQPRLYDDAAGFKLWTSAYSQGNSVPAQFSNYFLFPGFIDQDVKNNAYNRLKTINRFGAEFNYGIDVILTPDSTWKANGQHFLVAFRSQAILGATFPEDAFKLVFGGNAAYAGQTANFSNTNLFSINYDVFELGYQVHSKKSIMSIRIGAVKGNSFTNLDIKDGSLYTNIHGSSIDLTFDGKYVRSSASSNQFKASPSMGAMLSAEFIQLYKEKWIFKESIQDLGFINWNTSTTVTAKDTSFQFTGVDLGSILDVNDTTLIVGDSLQQKFLGSEVRQSQMEALPLRIQLEATRLFPNRWLGAFGFTYRHLVGYSPLVTATVGKGFGKGRSIRLMLAYGGFGTFQTGIRCVAFSNHHHSLSIGTMFNEGFLMPKSKSGAGIQLSYVHHL
jgi:hypothetical protein